MLTAIRVRTERFHTVASSIGFLGGIQWSTAKRLVRHVAAELAKTPSSIVCQLTLRTSGARNARRRTWQ